MQHNLTIFSGLRYNKRLSLQSIAHINDTVTTDGGVLTKTNIDRQSKPTMSKYTQAQPTTNNDIQRRPNFTPLLWATKAPKDDQRKSKTPKRNHTQQEDI